MTMTTELLAVLVGALVSLALEIIPGLKEVWSGWRWKPLTLFGGFLVIPMIIWALVCYGDIDVGFAVVCGVQGLLQSLWLGFIGFLGNQTGYSVGARTTPNAVARNGVGELGY